MERKPIFQHFARFCLQNKPGLGGPICINDILESMMTNLGELKHLISFLLVPIFDSVAMLEYYQDDFSTPLYLHHSPIGCYLYINNNIKMRNINNDEHLKHASRLNYSITFANCSCTMFQEFCFISIP